MCKIPRKVHNWYKKEINREKTLIKCGKKAFLDPERLKYPVVNPENCEYMIELIRCAKALAKLHKKYAIVRAAEKLEKQVLNESVSTMGAIQRTEKFTKSNNNEKISLYALSYLA